MDLLCFRRFVGWGRAEGKAVHSSSSSSPSSSTDDERERFREAELMTCQSGRSKRGAEKPGVIGGTLSKSGQGAARERIRKGPDRPCVNQRVTKTADKNKWRNFLRRGHTKVTSPLTGLGRDHKGIVGMVAN
jgi:hypothetical protein